MKLLEQIQNQLKSFHAKLTNNTNSTATTFTQQQIQAMLTQDEQNLLQKLIMQRKTVQSEIQVLQQKLLAPSMNAPTTTLVASPSATMTLGSNSLYVPTNSKPTVLNTATSNGQINAFASNRYIFLYFRSNFFLTDLSNVSKFSFRSMG